MKKDNKKPLPDFIQRRIPRHLWNTLHPVPTWEGVLYYDPLDFQLDRPLRFLKYAVLLLLVVDFSLDDLHICHDGNHLFLREQAAGFKAFVLVTASGRKDKA